MPTFRLGETVLYEKLSVQGIVEDETVIVKHIGNLLVHKLKVQVGDDHLEWLVKYVKPVQPTTTIS